MDKITDALTEAIHDFFVDACGGMFIGIFDDANAAVGDIGKEVAKTPSQWNSSIFSLVQSLSDNVIIPIAALIITGIFCYELITAITEKNNMHDIESFIFFKFFLKSCIAVILLSHTFEITMAIFDVGQWVVNRSSALISDSTYVDVNDIYYNFRSTLDTMDTGSLIVLMLEAAVVGLAVKAIAILVTVRYIDVRRFGRFWLLSNDEADTVTGMDKLGIEPDNALLTADFLIEKLNKRKKAIKEMLHDQTIIAGIGNIYSDEILHAARIYPEKSCNALTNAEWKRLAEQIPKVIAWATEANEITPEDYLAGNGKEYRNTPFLKAYGHNGKPCEFCGTLFEKLTVGCRSSCYCPKCQKK